MSAVIEIENLTKDYEVGFWRKRKVRALDDLSLTIERGEIFGFLGANGAGKTTTLKLLMRLVYPSAGHARILGHDINDVKMHARIGYLPENPYLYDYLTAREFLNYCAELFGYGAQERRTRAADMLARVHLDEAAWDKQLRKFSKGMLQRVGLAQSIIGDPEIVFLDEPMSGLDPVGRREARDLIASLRTEGRTVFLCSHILSDVEVLCDRIAIMKRGKLVETGRIEELRERSVGSSGDQSNHFEVMVAGVDAQTMRQLLPALAHSKINLTASGARLEIESEREVDKVLAALRQANGRLVSVQPLRQSLEELFIREVGESETKVATETQNR